MVRIYNGVYNNKKKQKTEVPTLILFKCVCHSIHLAVLHTSAECLLRQVKSLIAKTHKWFSFCITSVN